MGDNGVGKSSLIHRYCNGEFSENSLPADETSKYHDAKDKIIVGNKSIRLLILDMTANVFFHKGFEITKKAFVFLLFDVSARSTFEHLVEYIENFNDMHQDETRILYIIGNKTDKETREVSKEEAEKFAENYGVQYFEVSVKENKGIDDIFNRALEAVCQNLDQGKY